MFHKDVKFQRSHRLPKRHPKTIFNVDGQIRWLNYDS